MKRVSLTVLLLLCVLLGQLGVVSAQETFDESSVYNRMYRLLQRPGETYNSDLSGLDSGSSDFIRGMFCLNELTTDEAICGWMDSGIPDLGKNSWGYDLSQSRCMFERLAFGIYTCNFYLENTGDEQAQRRAEARFLRALCYYYMLEFFGNVPISTTTTTSLVSPSTFMQYMGYQAKQEVLPQNSRQEVYDFVESELLACVTDMQEPGRNGYGFADKAAAWMLLARLYQNAEVYTGTAQWQKASEYAYKIINCGQYSLSESYEKLFMGDNASNGAQVEMIFSLPENGETGNYGATTYLIASTYGGSMPSNGMNQYWAGVRTRPQLVEKFEYSDSRNKFYSDGHSLDIEDISSFYNGYAVTKWTNLHSDGMSPSSYDFAETDFPLFRYAEALLIAAEVDARQNGGSTSATGTALVNQVRSRANAVIQTSYSLNDIIDEYAREFYFEGHRRTDLIRFGRFTGSDYLWQWKGGEYDGTAIADYRGLFPLPPYLMSMSEDYAQNDGYVDVNQFQLDETFVLDTPAFAGSTVLLYDHSTLGFTWQKPSVSVASPADVNYDLQLSFSGRFLNGDDEGFDGSDALNGIGIGGTYINITGGNDIDKGTIDAMYLDMLLHSYNKVKRFSDMPADQPQDIYLRCVATVGFKKSVSNIVKVTVMPYINNFNTYNYYFYGEGIADGSATNPTVAGIGSSMVPMSIDYDSYGRSYGSMGGGLFTKTVYLDSTKKFRIGQFQSTLYTTDGSLENASVDNGSTEDFTVAESGWYQISLNPSGFYEVEGTTEEGYPNYVNKGAIKYEKVDEPGSTYRTVQLSGDITVTLQPSASDNNRDWYGSFSTEKDVNVHFLADRSSLGGNGFSFGYATPDGGEISVPAGSYIVTFDAATGFYDFFDVIIGIPEYFSSRAYTKDQNPVDAGKLVVKSVGTIDMRNVESDSLVKVCDIVIPDTASVENLHLDVNGNDYPLNADGTMQAADLERVVTAVSGESASQEDGQTVKTIVAHISGDYFVGGLSTKQRSNDFSISAIIDAEKSNFYLIGWINGWDATDKSFMLSTTDNRYYTIDISREQLGGANYFMIASGKNYSSDNFWDGEFIKAPYDACEDTSGYFTRGEGGGSSWLLPALPDGYDYYRLLFDLDYGWYEFIPLVAEQPQDVLPGDVNNDSFVNVTDVALMIDYVLGKNPAGFIYSAADVNVDQTVNVTDVVLVIDVILGKANLSRAMGPTADADLIGTIALPHTLYNIGEAVQIPVSLTNPTVYTAFQMDVTVPEGASLQKVQLTARGNETHTVSYRQIGENRYRLVGVSMDNESFTGNDGDLLNLYLQGVSQSSVVNMTVDNILFVTPSGIQHELASVQTGGTTKINGLSVKGGESANTSKYNLAGQKVNGSHKGIVIFNGKKTVVK